MQNFFAGHKIFNFSSLIMAATLAVLAGCGSGTPSTTGITPTSGVAATVTANSLQLTTSSPTVKSNSSDSATITITAVGAGGAALSDTTLTVSSNTGILGGLTGSSTVTTGPTGEATVTFKSGTLNKANRAATITATSGTASGQVVVQIVGSTVTVNSSTASVPDSGSSSATLTINVLDAGTQPISGVAVTLTKSSTGGGNVTITPSSLVTNSSGQITATVVGVSGGIGVVTVGVAAAGAITTTNLTVTPTAATFAIDQQKLNAVLIANNDITAMQIGQSLEIRVNVPGVIITSVNFISSQGDWIGSASSGVISVPVNAGNATATFTTTQAGTANITVLGSNNTSTDNLVVMMTAAATSAYSITLQAAPSTVTTNKPSASTLTATVTDTNGFPVGGAPVVFSILNPTGGGESFSDVFKFTDASGVTSGLSLGQAQTKFNSGSLSSGQTGVQIRARVIGTTVATELAGANATPSGNDAAIIIGGSAGSVVISYATELTQNTENTNYIWNMSVTVADSGGNPVPGAVVNLSAWPIAWSTGSGCAWDPDGKVWDPASGVAGAYVSGNGGTFKNEDVDENLILGSTEDGVRNYYYSTASAVGGTIDSKITPPNSAAGLLPTTVTTGTANTGVNGLATFQLIYPKSSALYIVDRIRASTTVQGSDAVGELVVRLAPVAADVGPPCLLPPSPYLF